MREKLTFANVMSSIAVFLALGGSAMALKANSVGSRQIKDDSIKGRDVREGKLKGKHIQRATIGAEQISEDAFDFEHFIQMKSSDSFCDPNSAAFVNCGSVKLSMLEPSRALLIAGGGQKGGSGASGQCKFRIAGQDQFDGRRDIGDPTARTGARQNGFSLTAVSGLLSPGVTDFDLVCNEGTGDVDFSTSLSVITLGGDAG